MHRASHFVGDASAPLAKKAGNNISPSSTGRLQCVAMMQQHASDQRLRLQLLSNASLRHAVAAHSQQPESLDSLWLRLDRLPIEEQGVGFLLIDARLVVARAKQGVELQLVVDVSRTNPNE